VISRAKETKEKTRAVQLQERIKLEIANNEIAKYSGEGAKTKAQVVEELKQEGLLTEEEATQLQENDTMTIDGTEIDFGAIEGTIEFNGEKWSYTDIDEDGTINVGDVYKVGAESFYVISTDNTTTVTLLAAKCVDTINNKQSDTASSVAFDSTEPYSNVYEGSTIEQLVNDYVDSLGTSVIEKRLMSKDEAEALEEKHGGILYAKNFWLGSPDESYNEYAYFVNGDEGWIKSDDGHNGPVYMNDLLGLRPVIVISKPNI
jgi:surface antigen